MAILKGVPQKLYSEVALVGMSSEIRTLYVHSVRQKCGMSAAHLRAHIQQDEALNKGFSCNAQIASYAASSGDPEDLLIDRRHLPNKNPPVLRHAQQKIYISLDLKVAGRKVNKMTYYQCSDN